jgi:hypothetical protein
VSLCNALSFKIARSTATIGRERERINARRMVVFKVYSMAEDPLISLLLLLANVEVN